METKIDIKFGFCGYLTITFIVLKLLGYINWSWIWVLSPAWIWFILIIILFSGVKIYNRKWR